MDRLIVYADYVCPYCYVAETQLERLRREVPIDIESAAFELRPPGTPLPQPDEWLSRDAVRAVEQLARDVGVPLTYPAISTRTRKAHEAAAYAREQGVPELHGAIYRAYWQDGRDIGRIDVLMELAVEAGLDGTALKVALDIDQYTDRVLQDEAEAAQYGIAGVPAYIGVTAGSVTAASAGLQRYDELRQWVMGNHDV